MRRAQLPSLLASLLLLLLQVSLGARPALDLEGSAESDLTLRLRFPEENRDGSGQTLRSAPEPDVASLLLRSLHRLSPEGELRRRLAELSDRLKRHEPPLSIDLTFHLLRHMMEISRAQSQQAQAELNRQLLDSVGK
ncbi:PREDICTED: urocortin [Thamnophis sirtalis]|uniref:Urocortin n=1 Tax=Thamnophis sirtalis TaxID=35019 RepID=A0A6I9XPU9_9SAUR|nr:PREDICTED: urocortin [Thamnophis sirtalis]XP_032071256.1 urocortin [Thamnophis elegans]